MILTISYLVYTVVEFMNKDPETNMPMFYLRCGIYLGMLLAVQIIFRINPAKKSTMILMAFTFLFAYVAVVAGNGAVILVMAFPALIGFMLYLNSLLVGIGCVLTFLVCVAKYFQVQGTQKIL